MKAVCIIGSPRNNGNTAYLIDTLIAGMRTRHLDVKRYVLGDLNIQFCTGCKICEETQKCVQRDDMDLLLDEIFEADIVVLASPSYWGDVTGQMKVFFDRSTPVCNARTGHSPVPSGKIGIGIAVRAGTTPRETQHIIEAFDHYFGHLGINMVDSLTVEGVDSLADLKQNTKKLDQAFRIGQQVVEKSKIFAFRG